jgi:single-strand DNA-binding protein
MNLNIVALVGCLGRDPETKYFDGGTVVTKFSIAVNRPKKDGVQEADWFDCEAWGKTAEFVANYIKKGNRVSIAGSLKQEKWESKDGEKRNKVIVKIDRLENLTPRDRSQDGAPSAVAQRTPLPAVGAGRPSTFDEEMPF